MQLYSRYSPIITTNTITRKILILFFTVIIISEAEADTTGPTNNDDNKRHPLEDHQSWELHLNRQQSSSLELRRRRRRRRQLQLQLQQEGQEIDNAVAIMTGSGGGTTTILNNPTSSDSSDNNNGDGNTLPFQIRHMKNKKHIPFAGGDTTHGIMIDAGSQGTRLHIYEWDKRFLLDEKDLIQQSDGKKLSYPTSNNRWTDQYKPGLDAFSNGNNGKDSNDTTLDWKHHPEYQRAAIGEYLGGLLNFAKEVLKDKQDEWHTYPIYLKATGGLRTLPQPERIRVMECVRTLFHNTTYNPFAFEDERARVLSGEEEAIYGWVAVNFAKGKLIDNSRGSGLGKDPKYTYGMLEMGGASTQIANFENHGDLMANLFKLQLGGARHWNVYVHSYLYFGINGAWSRLNSLLHGEMKYNNEQKRLLQRGGATEIDNDEVIKTQQQQQPTVNPCLPIGSSVQFDSWIYVNPVGQFYPRSAPMSTPYSITMVSSNETTFNFDLCSNHSYAMLRKETNQDWCDFQMDGNCGFAGIYQPPMSSKFTTNATEFIATSNFVTIFRFLRLGEKASIAQIGKAAENVCRLNWDELQVYNANLHGHDRVPSDLELVQYCFRSVFVYHLLRHGWEFGDEYELTAIDVIDGRKLGWALGCMLYEINTLPWYFHPELLYKGPSRLVISLYVVLGTLIGSVVATMVAMRTIKSLNKTVRESLFFQNHPGLANNPVVRKSLSLPDYGLDVDELDRLYQDQKDGERKSSNNNERIPLCSNYQDSYTYYRPV